MNKNINMEDDIRWIQRFQNFLKAFSHLQKAIFIFEQRKLSDLEKQGLIQAFEFTHELAWNVMRDYFLYQGNNTISGSRDATREAFNKGLIENGDGWMQMIKSRNESSHTYNDDTANEIFNKIIDTYYVLFADFIKKMNNYL
jgi:nucleotidyltransferase substrate binding protein (TIGR01987 family)